MKKVIIYGIGAMGENNLNQIRERLSDRYEVIGFMDSFYQKEFYQYLKVYKIGELPEMDYDYIVINAYNQSSDDEIYNLLSGYGVPNGKIVRYAKYAYRSPEFPVSSKFNKLMIFRQQNLLPEPDGLLIGMSYSELGVDVNRLSGCIYNLAAGALDLFYNKLMTESLFSMGKIIEQSRYFIFEMPYFIFNYDLSLCDHGLFQHTMNYISFWERWHHFREKESNKEFLRGFPVFQDMFLRDSQGNSSMILNCRAMSEMRILEEGNGDNVVSHTIKKNHIATVEENRDLFQQIIKMLKEKAPHIQTIILICPQPSFIRNLYEKYPLQKQIFWQEMRRAQEAYPDLIILDEQELFTGRDEYFADKYGHLNRSGCDKFTEFLDQKLREIDKI